MNKGAETINRNQTAEIYIASLIIDCTDCMFKPAGEVIGKEEAAIILRHGAYKYSKYSRGGGWILLAPSVAAVKEVIFQTVTLDQILATATIERQWEVKTGRGKETAASLARILIPQVPGFRFLSKVRSAEISTDIEKLCAAFIKRENKFRNFTIDNLPTDCHAYCVAEKDLYPLIFTSHDSLYRVDENEKIQKELLDLLVYYWESVFMIWWKGFW